MLLVILPGADVLGSIGMRICSTSVGFVVKPIAFVYISVRVEKFTLAISFAVSPVTFVARSIDPLLDTITVALIVEPLALVDSSIVKGYLASVLSDSSIVLLLTNLVIKVSVRRRRMLVELMRGRHEILAIVLRLSVHGKCLLHGMVINLAHSVVGLPVAVGKQSRAVSHF